jgi:hypothetical protein
MVEKPTNRILIDLLRDIKKPKKKDDRKYPINGDSDRVLDEHTILPGKARMAPDDDFFDIGKIKSKDDAD